MRSIDKNKGIIVSYPRSGLNWVRYCIETATGKRTPGRTKLIEKGEPVIYRTHNVLNNGDTDSCWCRFYGEDGLPLHNRMILLLRDYRESFLRVSKARKITPHIDMINSGKVFNFRDYFENIRAFHEFPKKKMLIRYEDLISDNSTIIKIMKFLELTFDIENLDIEEGKKESLKIYDRQHKSYTKSDVSKFSYHQEKADPDILASLEKFVKRNYRDISEIYLPVE